MLSPAEVHQAAVRAAPDATVVNRSSHAYATLPEEAGKGVRETTIDAPALELAFPGDIRVTFGVVRPGQPDARWLGVAWDGDRRLATVEVGGAGDVTRLIQEARALAGLPAPAGTPPLSNLTFGGAA